MKTFFKILILSFAVPTLNASYVWGLDRPEKLLNLHIQGPVQVTSQVERNGILEIRGSHNQKTLFAKIHSPSSRVLEIEVGAKTIFKWKGIQVVGHRATALFAPENTIAAIKKARELGVHSVELDVRQTKDGELIILHDETVDRTTNSRGHVADFTLAQLKTLDAGSHFSAEFAGEKIPTLQEALAELGKDLLPDIDFKSGDLTKLLKTLASSGFEGRVTFNGNGDDYKYIAREQAKIIIRPRTFWGVFGIHQMVQQYGATMIAIPEIQFSESYLRSVHERGLKSFVNVILYRTLEESRLKRVVKALPDYIQTDRPDILVPYLKSLELYKK